jgi:acetyl esterase/lipase
VYRPIKTKGLKLPVIISVHGGGWVYGDKELYQFYCMSLAQQGFAVINFSYPLAPKAKYPSILSNTYDVFTWAFKHADAYLLDTDRVFAVGDSAGAHTLAQLCVMMTNQSYAKRFNFKVNTRLLPKAVALNCGLYDATKLKKLSFLMSKLVHDYLPKGKHSFEYEDMNLLPHITSEFPPSFIMSSNGDFLLDQSIRLDETLNQKKVDHRFEVYGSPDKILGHVFHCDLRLEEARALNVKQCDYFKSF